MGRKLWSIALIIAGILLLLVTLWPGLLSGTAPNNIRWATQSEKDNFGYDIFRGPSEEGPFERLNPLPIAGAGTTDLPQRYEFRDTSSRFNTAYWYYVESISLDGSRKRVTPVMAARPKSLLSGLLDSLQIQF